MLVSSEVDFGSFVRSLGRNGGHLSANVHEGFSDREKIYGTDDAIREVALQHHNVSELLKVIRDNEKDTDLDVVAGGHLELFFTEKELEDAKADFLAAQAAGVDVRYVEWLGKEEVQAVSKIAATDSNEHSLILVSAIWRVLPWCSHAREQFMAPQDSRISL